LVNETATSAKLVSYLERLLGRNFFPVRAFFLDKTAESNWRVPWHQDLTIAVAEQIGTPDFAAWSIKDGILHVQPPQEILKGMITVRLHLDDCDAHNDALKVIPGSHLQGKLGALEIAGWTQRKETVVCEVLKGGALLMRPLLLHSSSPAKNSSHRRVLHVEYAAQELPNGLKWFDR
jgi:ectoine hydroxylase-related dioxygenase (phytanoyl-CoA dioxygenase family)